MNKRTIAAIIALAVAGTVQADIMSLNVWGFDNDINRIDDPETYGVASLNTVVGNWNNTGATGGSNLILDDGSASTIGYTATAPNARAGFNAVYNQTALKGGFDSYLASDVSMTITNLNANFADGYYAIVYVTGFLLNTGASISDGTSTYYFQTPNPENATLVQTLDTNVGDGYDVATYAVFGSELSALTADSITFTLDTIEGGGTGFGGVQIVAIPEPATAGLFAVLGGGLLWIRRVFMP